jgi:tetrahydromethanopterin S-methyltransferase subunit F
MTEMMSEIRMKKQSFGRKGGLFHGVTSGEFLKRKTV